MKLIIHRYEVILSLVVCILTLNVAVTTNHEVISVSSIPPLETSASGTKKLIALTFDDGPHPYYTQKLIELLKRHNVPATFFVVGSQVEKYPHLIKELAFNGFELGGHTYTHRNMKTLTRQEIITELEKTRLLIKEHTQQNTYIYRPPGGQFNQDVRNIAEEFGYKMVLWDVFPRDHQDNLTEDVLYKRIMQNVNNGGIVLLHSGKDTTISALEKIIPELKSRGYDFVTVSQYEKNFSN